MQDVDTGIAGRVKQILSRFKILEGPLLPVLHAVQEEFGYVPADAIPVIAQELNLSRADVYGVATLYPDFRDRPPGRNVLKLCRAESCQAMNGEMLGELARRRLGVDWYETSADGLVTLEPVYCLGICSHSPAMILNGELIGCVDEKRLLEIASEIQSGSTP